MKPFNQLFGESGGDPIDVEGVTVNINLKIFPTAPTRIEWAFDSPHGADQVALRIKGFRCSFSYPRVDRATEVFAVHGEANRGAVTVDRLGKNPVVSITNAYRPQRDPSVWETFFGNQGMIVEEESAGNIYFRANNGDTADRMAFRDIRGVVRISELGTEAEDFDGPVLFPTYPIESYCFIDAMPCHEGEDGALLKVASGEGEDAPVISKKVQQVIDRLRDTSARVVASSAHSVTLEVNLEDDVTTDFAMFDEARLHGLTLIRVGDMARLQ
ncbi:hypothetical protein [Corynebacterium cystitidis]|uniref:hypothetical protein n=1 Tax=Corynebacterium cystitidis TaxID=35757 RepID=UPI00211E5C06|nr:hypothetical protein [Corynebacterium cystitidis]